MDRASDAYVVTAERERRRYGGWRPRLRPSLLVHFALGRTRGGARQATTSLLPLADVGGPGVFIPSKL